MIAGGVGFDINCGVRLLRSDLRIEDIENIKTQLADTLFKTIPVGVVRSIFLFIFLFLVLFHLSTLNSIHFFPIDRIRQGEGSILGRLSVEELDEVLTTGMKWAEKKNLVWSSDR